MLEKLSSFLLDVHTRLGILRSVAFVSKILTLSVSFVVKLNNRNFKLFLNLMYILVECDFHIWKFTYNAKFEVNFKQYEVIKAYIVPIHLKGNKNISTPSMPLHST